MTLGDRELERYARHIMLDCIGLEGQERLAVAHAVAIGAGGLGCPAATYLATAGFGKLTIVDDDTIEAANLQRQFLYRDEDLGKPKAAVAAQRLAQLGPNLEIETHEVRADADNIAQLIRGCTVVLDGSDNFATRHVVNRASADAGIPLVSGAAEGCDGQLAVFNFAVSSRPCYACLYPPSAAAQLPETPCATLGVFAPLAGMIGSLMAGEAIKIAAASEAQTLKSKLLAVDLASMRIRQLALAAAPDCPVCG